MIKGSAIVEFGMGSVAIVSGVSLDSEVGGVFMKTCPPGKIESGVLTRIDSDEVFNKPEVAIYFRNIQSLDHHISLLTALRAQMVGCQEDENNADE